MKQSLLIQGVGLSLLLIFSIAFVSALQVGNAPTDRAINLEPASTSIYTILNTTIVNASQYANCWSTAEGIKCDVADILGSEITNDLEWWDDVGNDWLYDIGTTLWFNESKLATIYYNATQSNAVAGTINGGTLGDTQHQDGNYDGRTFNFTEVAGSPGLDLRMNFTNIESFNAGVMRYKTSSLAGEYPIIQLWDYDTLTWEDYPAVAESTSFATIEQPVFDDTDHIHDGVVQMRLYKASNGNTNNHYYVDWVAISKGFGTPAGEEIDPLSLHRDGTIEPTGNFDWNNYNITNANVVDADIFTGNGYELTGLTYHLVKSSNWYYTFTMPDFEVPVSETVEILSVDAGEFDTFGWFELTLFDSMEQVEDPSIVVDIIYFLNHNGLNYTIAIETNDAEKNVVKINGGLDPTSASKGVFGFVLTNEQDIYGKTYNYSIPAIDSTWISDPWKIYATYFGGDLYGSATGKGNAWLSKYEGGEIV